MKQHFLRKVPRIMSVLRHTHTPMEKPSGAILGSAQGHFDMQPEQSIEPQTSKRLAVPPESQQPRKPLLIRVSKILVLLIYLYILYHVYILI